jgi:hypothetical protein
MLSLRGGEWINTGIVWAVPLALNLRALTRLNPETLIGGGPVHPFDFP